MLTTNQYLNERKGEQGFTLIELSIVLVIIGLIVGGVLVGQDLIRAAEVRATISQIEKYNTATNTFRGKFNAIPGDMNATTAATFGFGAIGGTRGAAGQGDGNGVIDGGTIATASGTNLYQAGGETGVFWVDLSSSVAGNLIDGGFSAAAETTYGSPPSTGLNAYLPPAKLGRGNMIYVFENGGTNYFGMENVAAITAGLMTGSTSLSVIQAYNIDKKMDDGIPASGNVMVALVSSGVASIGNGTAGFPGNLTAALGTTAAATICYDTANSTAGEYDLSENNGAGAYCALTFKFQ